MRVDPRIEIARSRASRAAEAAATLCEIIAELKAEGQASEVTLYAALAAEEQARFAQEYVRDLWQSAVAADNFEETATQTRINFDEEQPAF